MFGFELSGQPGEESKKYRVVFRHRGQVRAKHLPKYLNRKHGRSPRSTECVIVSESTGVSVSGVSKCCSRYARIIKADAINNAFKEHGRRVKRVYKTDDKNTLVIIIAADNFSFREGRLRAFEKAIEKTAFSSEQRGVAWRMFHEYNANPKPFIDAARAARKAAEAANAEHAAEEDTYPHATGK